MYKREGKRRPTYYMISPDNRYIGLGHRLDEAIEKYRELMAAHNDLRWMPSIATESEAVRLFELAKKGAKRRGIEFSISLEDISRVLLRSNGFCELTKSPFSHRATTNRVRPFAPSIDRIDSSVGYTKDNIRVVTTMANIAINQFGDAAFLSMLSGYLNALMEKAS